jgi:hypothetical protein
MFVCSYSFVRTAKFNKIHAKASAQSESIVDHYNKLNEKKRAAAQATPLIGANKKARTAMPNASPSVPTSVPLAPFILPIGSPSMPHTGSAFTQGVTGKAAPSTNGVAKRTRSSFKKDGNAHLAQSKSKAAVIIIAARKSMAASKSKDVLSDRSSLSTRPLFTSRVGRVAPPSSSSTTTAASTFTSINVAPQSSAESKQQIRRKTVAVSGSKSGGFDLAASLAKPITWKMHSGAMPKGNKNSKENANPIVNPFTFTLNEPTTCAAKTDVVSAFSVSSHSTSHVFGVSTASNLPSASPVANGTKTVRADIKATSHSAAFGVSKDVRRSNFQHAAQDKRRAAQQEARRNRIAAGQNASIAVA